jgi:amino acid adenylation domain-containing protein
MTKSARSLVAGFVNSVERFPARPALVVDSKCFSYLDLKGMAARIASAIRQNTEDPYPLVALLAYRSTTAYSGVLGILATGKGYVPLNPKLPLERTRQMLIHSGCTALIVGRECFHQLPQLLADLERPLRVILPDVADAKGLSEHFSHHRFLLSEGIRIDLDSYFQTEANPTTPAYLLFTSGSTGEPKGVPISQWNVRSYIDYVCDRFDINEHDRFSQEFDLTFDLSVHDMFVCWERGACLFSVPQKSVMAPAKFIRDHQLTMWFSVPSVIGVLSKMKLLPAGCLPSLRYSLFCGEPLLATCAQLWQEAARNSIIENLYGPTETTIAISHYRWDQHRSPGACLNGIVPLGWLFEGQLSSVIDTEGNIVPAGTSGELCLAGSQVTTGYWNNRMKTRQQFVQLSSDRERVWYRTGDLVKQDNNGCIYYLGRTDNQVKIRGYRVELQEIEAVLRKVCGTEQVIAVAWPVTNGSAEGIVGFLAGVQGIDEYRVLSRCSEILPEYMVPRKLYVRDQLPFNAHGKVDRLTLIHFLKSAEQ